MKFQLAYPIRPWLVTQHFGDTANIAYYKANGINFKGHNGYDIIAYHGQPIYAAHDGIAYWEVDGSLGMGVVICSESSFEYPTGPAKMKTIYWHMCDPEKEPQFRSPIYGNVPVKVKRGDLIGYADNTGLSTGNHLHFGLKPGLPNEPDAQFINLVPDNGYMGAIDPTPYFDGTFAVPTFTRDMSLGSIGADVTQLQQYLISAGLLTTGVFGFFGPKTQAAVKAFQAAHSLPVVGRVGPATRAVLNSLVK